MKTKAILIITQKEIKKFFDHFNGYLLVLLFLSLNYFFFLKVFFLNSELSLRSLFYNLSWILPVFVASLSMGAFAHEKDKSTLEYLMTKPIKIGDLILGKIFGISSVAVIAVLLTLPLAFLMSMFGVLDFGEIFSSYLGVIIFVLATVSLGVGISSFFNDQIIAFILTSVVLLFLNLFGSDFTIINLPVNLANFISKLGIFSHYDSFIRGIIRLEDLFYFIILFVIGFLMARINLAKVRLNISQFLILVRNLTTKVSLWFLAIFIVVLMNTFWLKINNLKLDLTYSQKYSLSKITKDILSQGDNIKITAYLSDGIPTQYQSLVKELKYILTDYQSASKGKLEVIYIDPAGKEQELQKEGVNKANFSIMENDNFQQKSGYLSLVLENKTKLTKQPLNLASGISDNLDYTLTKIIYKLKNNAKIKVAFASGEALEKDFLTSYNIFSGLLKEDFELIKVALPIQAEEITGTKTSKTEKVELPSLNEYKILILANPKKEYTVEAQDSIKQFYENGGGILYLADGMEINSQFNLALANSNKSGQLFSDYGVTVKQGLLEDYQHNVVVNMDDGSGNGFLVNYAFWLINQSVFDKKKFNFLPDTLVMPWASSLDLVGESWQKLYQTSDSTLFKEATSSMSLEPRDKKTVNLQKSQSYVTSAILENSKGGKLAVIANSSLFEDQFMGNRLNPQNLLFGLGLFEKLGDSANISTIKARSLSTSRFLIEADQEVQKDFFRFGSFGFSVGVLAIIGYWRWWRVKNLANIFSDLDL